MNTNVRISDKKIVAFGGAYHIAEVFDTKLAPTIDRMLGKRGSRSTAYSYSDIIRTLAVSMLCGGDRIEDVNTLCGLLSENPITPKLCGADSVLRLIEELAVADTLLASGSGKLFAFNVNDRLNDLLVALAVKTGALKPGRSYTLDFDHQFLRSGTAESKPTYKHYDGYSPAVATLTDEATGQTIIVHVENRDGNANVRFRQEETLTRVLDRLDRHGLRVNLARMDCGSYTRPVVELLEARCGRFIIRHQDSSALGRAMGAADWRAAPDAGRDVEVASAQFEGFGGALTHLRTVAQRTEIPPASNEPTLLPDLKRYSGRALVTNIQGWTEESVIRAYNKRGGKGRVFDQMGNDFGWRTLPKSRLRDNCAFMLLTAIIRNFYAVLVASPVMRRFGVEATTRLKRFIALFVSVAASVSRSGRRLVLTLFTPNRAYALLAWPRG